MQKTPNKLTKSPNGNDVVTPEKESNEENYESSKCNSTPSKELKKIESEFKTPEKASRPNNSVDSNENNKTPGQNVSSFDHKLEQITSFDGEDEMISTVEQARLLIAAGRTPSKSVNKTPVKQTTPSAKRSVENSPVTPGKHRRVELITLSSPKAKRIKQM